MIDDSYFRNNVTLWFVVTLTLLFCLKLFYVRFDSIVFPLFLTCRKRLPRQEAEGVDGPQEAHDGHGDADAHEGRPGRHDGTGR